MPTMSSFKHRSKKSLAERIESQYDKINRIKDVIADIASAERVELQNRRINTLKEIIAITKKEELISSLSGNDPEVSEIVRSLIHKGGYLKALKLHALDSTPEQIKHKYLVESTGNMEVFKKNIDDSFFGDSEMIKAILSDAIKIKSKGLGSHVDTVESLNRDMISDNISRGDTKVKEIVYNLLRNEKNLSVMLLDVGIVNKEQLVELYNQSAGDINILSDAIIEKSLSGDKQYHNIDIKNEIRTSMEEGVGFDESIRMTGGLK